MYTVSIYSTPSSVMPFKYECNLDWEMVIKELQFATGLGFTVKISLTTNPQA